MTPIDSATPTTQPGKSFLKAVDRVLYPITLGYTAVILGFVFYEFFQGGRFQPRYAFGDVYLALLTAYAAQREGSKWLGADEAAMRIRRGELFVGVWFAVYLLMIAMANLSTRWGMPIELKSTTLGVLGIFIATGISSGLRGKAAERTATNTPDRRALLIQFVAARDGVTAEEAAAHLGISTTTAWRMLESVEKEGRIKQDQSADPRQKRYRAT